MGRFRHQRREAAISWPRSRCIVQLPRQSRSSSERMTRYFLRRRDLTFPQNLALTIQSFASGLADWFYAFSWPLSFPPRVRSREHIASLGRRTSHSISEKALSAAAEGLEDDSSRPPLAPAIPRHAIGGAYCPQTAFGDNELKVRGLEWDFWLASTNLTFRVSQKLTLLPEVESKKLLCPWLRGCGWALMRSSRPSRGSHGPRCTRRATRGWTGSSQSRFQGSANGSSARHGRWRHQTTPISAGSGQIHT